MFLLKLAEALDIHKVDYALVGGAAVVLHGVIRGTHDLDLVVGLGHKDLARAEAALKSIGLTSRLPIDSEMVARFRKEYIEKRNLIAWSFVNYQAPQQAVDLLLTHDRKKIKIDKIRIAGYPIKVAKIADLIKMKKQSGREQDLEDIKSLKELIK